MVDTKNYSAFAGEHLIVSGDLKTMILRTKAYIDGGGGEPILIFDDHTGKEIDFDFRGTPDEVLAKLTSHPLFAPPAAPPKSGPGRPSLGVVSREVTLLPRHWDWLSEQQGGISATLRRLVDEERKRKGGKERVRAAREAAGRFMWAIAGNQPGFEEASRALYAKDHAGFRAHIREWPVDIRDHLDRLVGEVERLEQEETPKG